MLSRRHEVIQVTNKAANRFGEALLDKNTGTCVASLNDLKHIHCLLDRENGC